MSLFPVQMIWAICFYAFISPFTQDNNAIPYSSTLYITHYIIQFSDLAKHAIFDSNLLASTWANFSCYHIVWCDFTKFWYILQQKDIIHSVCATKQIRFFICSQIFGLTPTSCVLARDEIALDLKDCCLYHLYVEVWCFQF